MFINGLTVLGDPNIKRGYGVRSGDYYVNNLEITNADIENMAAGFGDMTDIINLTLRNSILKNFSSNFSDEALATPGSGENKTPKRIILDNVKFGAPAGANPINIYMHYAATTGSANFIQSDQLFVYNYNGVQGDNFQVYYNEQRPDFIVPKTDGSYDNWPTSIGAPEAGLTNQQAWDKYKIAIAGAVAPSDAVTRTGITGLVRSLDLPAGSAPEAETKSANWYEDVPVTALLLARTAVGASIVKYEIIQTAANGAVKLDGNSATYAPKANWNGLDSFTYRAQDSNGVWSQAATIWVTVLPVNDAPTAFDGSVKARKDTPIWIDLRQYVRDVEGDPIIFLDDSLHGPHGPSNPGTLTQYDKTTGRVLYTPAAGFTGSLYFMFRVSDGRLNSDLGTVAITVT